MQRGDVVVSEHQIRCFLLVAEEGSFSKAARRSAVSQPAISKTIAALEGELGVRLFSRQGNTAIALTEAGERYLAFFQSAAAQWAALHSDIEAMSSPVALRFALPACLEGLFSLVLSPLRNENPNFTFPYLPPEQIPKALAKGELDFALCLQEELAQGRQYTLTSVGRSEAVILFSALHFTRFDKAITPAGFADAVFYLPQGEQYRRMSLQLEQACLSHGFMPRVVYLPDWADVLERVQVGQGVTLCYALCAAQHKSLSSVGLGAFQAFSLAGRRQLPPNVCDDMLHAVKQYLK